MVQAVQVIKKLLDDYQKSTPSRLKIIDAYMVYILLTGIAQFVYCLLVGTFPFNSFLSGFISTVTSFVLASCLRTQVNEENKSEFSHISPERAFADFIFAHVVLHLVVANFLETLFLVILFIYFSNFTRLLLLFRTYCF
uniref:Dolichyl-diphosphooligosaccharide--protein glycosyltransferase subunit DAD1 n=1 Tax=Haemonchus contortus TaxID=6289 RepID=A0A7I4XV18_HAECO